MQETLNDYIDRIKKDMYAVKNDVKAKNMAAYLKNHFDCYGIKSPVRNEIQRPWILAVKAATFDHWDVVYRLWELDQREFQYIAMDYMKKIPTKWIGPDDDKYLEELITTKSWWDSVDHLASNYTGRYLKKFPEKIDEVIGRWRNSSNMWLNRTCIIFQLKYGHDTDFELLKSLILQYKDVKEFFIQKAIGWSLRQYSKFNPNDVRTFVLEAGLKGLAYREATKYI